MKIMRACPCVPLGTCNYKGSSISASLRVPHVNLFPFSFILRRLVMLTSASACLNGSGDDCSGVPVTTDTTMVLWPTGLL